jgi:hypothetical protein
MIGLAPTTTHAAKALDMACDAHVLVSVIFWHGVACISISVLDDVPDN